MITQEETTVKVSLNREQHLLAFQKGLERQWEHRDEKGERFGTLHKFEAQQNDFLADVAGCSAELAVAEYYGGVWNGDAWDLRDHAKHTFQPDVEPHFEVRRVIERKKGKLTIRNSDQDYKIAILTFVEYPENRVVHILGGMSVKEAREKFGHTKDSRGNIYITQDKLYPPEHFKL